jgi:predicted RNA-binding protein with PIN domain
MIKTLKLEKVAGDTSNDKIRIVVDLEVEYCHMDSNVDDFIERVATEIKKSLRKLVNGKPT